MNQPERGRKESFISSTGGSAPCKEHDGKEGISSKVHAVGRPDRKQLLLLSSRQGQERDRRLFSPFFCRFGIVAACWVDGGVCRLAVARTTPFYYLPFCLEGQQGMVSRFFAFRGQ